MICTFCPVALQWYHKETNRVTGALLRISLPPPHSPGHADYHGLTGPQVKFAAYYLSVHVCPFTSKQTYTLCAPPVKHT